MNLRMLTGAIAFALAFSVQAEEWTGGLELGFSNTSGNSRDTSLNTRFDLKRSNAVWHHEFFGDAYYARSDGDETAERFSLGYKPKYYLSDRDYLFGTLRFERDRFSDILSRWTQLGGYGRQLIDTPRTRLSAEVGAGARQTRYDVNPDDLNRSEPILYLGGEFSYAISDTARFIQSLRIEYGAENAFTESVTGLSMRVTDSISAKLTHTIRHNSDQVGVRGKRTDQLTGVNMVYGF